MHEAIANHLYKCLAGRATGRSEGLILDNRPRNVLFAGCLMPRPDAAEDNLESAEDFYARLAPSAMQLRFLVRGEPGARLEIRPHFHVYYRIIPPFEAQDRRTPKGPDGKPMEESLVKAYRKCVPSFLPVIENLAVGERPVVALGSAVNEAVASAVGADRDALRPRESWKVPSNGLASAESLRHFCMTTPDEPRPPTFKVDLHVDVQERGHSSLREVTVA